MENKDNIFYYNFDEGDNITITCDFLNHYEELLEKSIILQRLKKYIELENSTYVCNKSFYDMKQITEGKNIKHNLENRRF